MGARRAHLLYFYSIRPDLTVSTRSSSMSVADSDIYPNLTGLRFKRRRNPITNKGEHYCFSIYISQMNGMNDKEGQESPDLRSARESNSRYAYSAFVGGHQTLAFVSHLYPTSR